MYMYTADMVYRDVQATYRGCTCTCSFKFTPPPPYRFPKGQYTCTCVCVHVHTIPVLCVILPILYVNLQSTSCEEFQLTGIKCLQEAHWHYLTRSSEGEERSKTACTCT